MGVLADYDVVIVGGGPAGISTALFLVHQRPELRDRVLVIEKETYPREKFCAGGVGARADKLLARIGVVVEVPSAFLNGIAFRCQAGQVVGREERIGRVVRRKQFDHELMKAAERRGVRVQQGCGLKGIIRVENGFELSTELGLMRARVVVGADGVGSLVRKSFDFAATCYRAQVIELDTEMVASDLPRDIIRFDVRRRELPGYYWDFPTVVNNEPMMCRGVYLLKQGADEQRVDIQKLLASELAERGLNIKNYRQKRFAERGFEPHRPLAQPGVLLVGEAAGIDPISGEGIAHAIQYGALAGEYLGQALRTGQLGFTDWERAVMRSEVGRDLWVRTLGVPLFYGRWRPAIESFLLSHPEFLQLGMQYFGGKPLNYGRALRVMGSASWHTSKALLRGAA